MIRITHKGNFNRTEKFLIGAKNLKIRSILDRYGREGVNALASATPLDSGKTADSWDYTVEMSGGSYAIYWSNSNVNKGVSIALILQYGHGTGTGGYVQGRDYINPAIKPVFDALADAAWKEVTSL